MDSKDIIYYLLHRAFTDLRSEGYNAKQAMIFFLADLCQDIPLYLQENQRNCPDILQLLQERAKGQQSHHWLKEVISEYSKNYQLINPDIQVSSTTELSGETCNLIAHILYQALVDIRWKGHEIQNKHVCDISDIFHAIPKDIELATENKRNCDEILEWIKSRALENGCESWINEEIAKILGSDNSK